MMKAQRERQGNHGPYKTGRKSLLERTHCGRGCGAASRSKRDCGVPGGKTCRGSPHAIALRSGNGFARERPQRVFAGGGVCGIFGANQALVADGCGHDCWLDRTGHGGTARVRVVQRKARAKTGTGGGRCDAGTLAGAVRATARRHHEKPCLESGSERMRVPVTAKMALHTAGSSGGSAGSPRPVGGLSVLKKCTSISAGIWFMRTGGYSWKLLCTARPPSIVIS